MRVMIIGASANRAKFGNKAVRAYLRQGHTVLPVNPTSASIEGLAVYRTIAAVPGPIDRAAVYVPPEIGVTLMPELAVRGDVAEIWLNPGADGPAVINEAERLGLHIIIACAIVNIGERP